MVRAICYVRVSTQEQVEEGVSIDAQTASVEAYCRMRRLEIGEIVLDAGVSGGKPLSSREGGLRVLHAVRSGQAQAVVSYKLDRLFRDASDCLAVTAGWDKAGIALHLIDLGGQSIDTSSAMGRFMMTVIAAAGEMERNLIRERTRAAMRYKSQRGEYTGGKARYGYRVSEDGVNLIEVHSEQQAILEARRLRAKGLSLRAISIALHEMGFSSRVGRPLVPVAVRNMTSE